MLFISSNILIFAEVYEKHSPEADLELLLHPKFLDGFRSADNSKENANYIITFLCRSVKFSKNFVSVTIRDRLIHCTKNEVFH